MIVQVFKIVPTEAAGRVPRGASLESLACLKGRFARWYARTLQEMDDQNARRSPKLRDFLRESLSILPMGFPGTGFALWRRSKKRRLAT
jgi:hypothetical protein